MGPWLGLPLWLDSWPSLLTLPPTKRAPATPQLSYLHWPWLDGGAVPAQAAQGRHAGGSFLGQQIPAGIVAEVACRVSWIQDDGPAIAVRVRLMPGNIGVSS